MFGKIENLGSLPQQIKSTMLITLWCFIGLEGAVVLLEEQEIQKM